jgi:hypothetical protein
MKFEFYFDEVMGRVKKALKIKTDKELAERLNMKETTFNSRKKANSLPFEELLGLANTENWDFNWVLKGEGTMYQSAGTLTPRQKALLDNYENMDEHCKRTIEAAASAAAQPEPAKKQA